MASDSLQTFAFKEDGATNELSLYDPKARRVFLKRSAAQHINIGDLFVGSTITVYARQLRIQEYANSLTKSYFEKDRGRVVTIIQPNAYRQVGEILGAASANDFTVSKLKTITAYPEGGVAVALELVGTNAVDSWTQVLATNNFGEGVGAQPASKETDELFASSPSTATFDSCSLLVVKPHAVKAGNYGAIVSALINANFEVSAVELFTLARMEVENFYEVYNTVVSPREFTDMVAELSSGPCIAIEVRAENCVRELRQLCGPRNVDIATSLRPTTLRARFGKSTVENAVHCTDLEEDGVLESQFFFKILQKSA